jgi:hypothetical protein
MAHVSHENCGCIAQADRLSPAEKRLQELGVELEPVVSVNGVVTDFDVIQNYLLLGEAWTDDGGASWTVELVPSEQSLAVDIEAALKARGTA